MDVSAYFFRKQKVENSEQYTCKYPYVNEKQELNHT